MSWWSGMARCFAAGTFWTSAQFRYTALVLGGAVDPEYKVYAFEPERFNYAFLERSCPGTQSARKNRANSVGHR